MTLLVLDLRTPAAGAIHSEQDLWSALSAMAPQLTTYLMSFLTLGIFWNGQQAQLNHLERSDRHLTWIPHRVPLYGLDYAFLHQTAGRIHYVSDCPALLLDQYPASRSDALPQLALRRSAAGLSRAKRPPK